MFQSLVHTDPHCLCQKEQDHLPEWHKDVVPRLSFQPSWVGVLELHFLQWPLILESQTHTEIVLGVLTQIFCGERKSIGSENVSLLSFSLTDAMPADSAIFSELCGIFWDIMEFLCCCWNQHVILVLYSTARRICILFYYPPFFLFSPTEIAV